MNIAGNKGLTLVEVLVVTLLSTVVMAGIYSTFIVGNRTWAYYNDSVLIKKEARRALFRMAGELREAENVRVIQSPDGNALHFYREASGPVSYYWSRKGEDADRVIRRDRVNSRIIAQYITELAYYDLKDAVVVDITASRQKASGATAEIFLREKIALRAETTLFK
ncbi:MAG: hypothetical protein A3C36_01360 [Omnitrophica WOR_2 bacterium RIFCSPHIGHO2_02_FULL_52_10]|nr:MAG: hypothetical protein A3C36_01360 [Omnitrophica WOR_2 bacterium RIFCSPHIGHO2_02_FULL_52_10]